MGSWVAWVVWVNKVLVWVKWAEIFVWVAWVKKRHGFDCFVIYSYSIENIVSPVEYDLIVPTVFNKVFLVISSFFYPNETDVCVVHFYIYYFFSTFFFKLTSSLLLNTQNNESREWRGKGKQEKSQKSLNFGPPNFLFIHKHPILV